MGNCVSILKRKKEPSKAITLAIVGLDNSGKTTLCSVFAGERPDPVVAPTVGFRSIKFSQCNFDITLFDLGGGKNIRPIWKSYYSEVYGVIYVLDSSSPTVLAEAREVLHDTLEHPQISGKPLLILANKVDKDDHMEEVDIVNGLKLEESVNDNNCPSKMVMTSALSSMGTKLDKELQAGMSWFLEKIRDLLGSLEPRVKEDMRMAKEARDKEREERRVRVEKRRKERDKEEERERIRLGLPKDKEDSDEDIVDGGPFKALDMATLTEKERRAKEEKHRRQKLLKQFDNNSSLRKRSKDDSELFSVDDNFRSSLTNRSLDRQDTNYAALNLFSNRRKGGSTLPPLEPLGSNTQQENYLGGGGDRKKGKKKKKLTDYQLSGREQNGYTLNERNDAIGRLGLSMHDSDSWNRDTGVCDLTPGVHDLTPRVAKPKKNRAVKAGRIEEDVDGDYGREQGVLEKNLYNIDRGNSYRQNKYDDVYPSKPVTRDLGRFSNRSQNHRESETDRYRNSLNKISPPNLSRFEEEDEDNEKDEGIEEDSDNDSDEDRYRTNSYSRERTSKKQSSRPVKSRPVLSDEEQEDYLSHSVLTDRLRFPRDDDDEVPIDFKKEMAKLHQRKNQGALKGRSISHRGIENGGYTGSRGRTYDDDDDEDNRYKKVSSRFQRSGALSPSEDDDDDRAVKSVERADKQRKKKRSYLLRSNKLAPSDHEDEVEPQGSYRFSSPRLVQEHGSRNSSDVETPSRNRNSRLTQFHSNMSRDSGSDFSTKWGLADDLPSIDDGNMRRYRTPNFDDSDGDVMF